MKELERLKLLCGLSPNELADVLENNPRAYMAVKGAVAEKHLQLIFDSFLEQRKIHSYKVAESDFDKDFYVKLLNGKEVIIECKNVQVLPLNSKSNLLSYFYYLQESKKLVQEIDISNLDNFLLKDLKLIYKGLPQKLRESGIARYEFSAQKMKIHSINHPDFLSQFDKNPLTIDFQRTRNSTEISSDEPSKAGRFYRLDEIHLVAACLFSRTMKWEFIFGSKNAFDIHPKYQFRYSNRLILKPGLWYHNFFDCVNNLLGK
jgi:hypothetical protein